MAAPAEESETASVYQEHEEKLRNFLLGFQEDDVDGQPVKKYIALLQEIADRHSKILEVELDDIHEEMGEEMADTIRGNALRYKEIIARLQRYHFESQKETIDLPTEEAVKAYCVDNPKASLKTAADTLAP